MKAKEIELQLAKLNHQRKQLEDAILKISPTQNFARKLLFDALSEVKFDIRNLQTR